jgi:GNAT superfamily N-acetyltransferase
LITAMKNSRNIREAALHEAPIISRLIREAYRDVAARFNLTPANCPKHPSNCSNQWVEDDLQRGVMYYILESSEVFVGCAALEIAGPDLGYLERVAVLPGYRRRGYGTALVEYVLAQAGSNDIKSISIGIISQQTELKAWYSKIGFVEKETKEFPHLPFIVAFMTYALSGGRNIAAMKP